MSLLSSIAEIVRQEKKFIGIFLFYTLCVSILLRFYPLRDIVFQVERFGSFAALAFIGLYLVRGFLYFPTLYFLIGSGLLFPPLFGWSVYLVAILLSATLSYGIGRYLHHSNRFPRFKAKIQDPDIAARIDAQGLRGVFFFHVTGISLDIPNYLSGYVGLSYRRFVTTVLLANVITATGYYLIFVRPFAG